MRRYLLLLVLLLASCAQPPIPTPKPPYDAGLRDGSVIFWQGGLLVKPILRNTDSDITHAAIVLYNGKEPFVYEAVLPCVHKVPMAVYRKLMQKKMQSRRPVSWFIMQPVTAYTTGELAAMKAHAESQLGRPYMLRGWWKWHEVYGIFCSQLVGDIIEKSGKIQSAHFRESPGSLHDKLLPFYKDDK